MTKREILRFLASIHPLGLVPPVSLAGKLIYRDVCDLRLLWDAVVPPQIFNRWKKIENALPAKVEVPRSITAFEEPTDAVQLHAFGDTSSD